MIISKSVTRLHWNYFIALEHDLGKVARFIEFSKQNFGVYSIELAHLLFAASSEAEVVAKQLCLQIDPTRKQKTMGACRRVLKPKFQDIAATSVFIPRFDLEFSPWLNWDTDSKTECWWDSYNAVKHDRHNSFSQATLENVFNALGGLLVLNYKYYAYALSDQKTPLSPQETMSQLEPQSSLLRLSEDHYYGQVVSGTNDW